MTAYRIKDLEVGKSRNGEVSTLLGSKMSESRAQVLALKTMIAMEIVSLYAGEHTRVLQNGEEWQSKDEFQLQVHLVLRHSLFEIR